MLSKNKNENVTVSFVHESTMIQCSTTNQARSQWVARRSKNRGTKTGLHRRLLQA